jgi:chemotaxis protein MotB
MATKLAKDQHQGKEDKPKIIIKKAKGHHGGGHHGGAWKVAYADFVTAMMALFIVLWVLGASDKKFKSGLAHYFREPGVFNGSRGIVTDGGQDRLGAGIIQAPSLEVLESYLKADLAGLKDIINKDQVPITITTEGLLIEIIDKEKQAFFDVSSASIKPIMRKVLEIIVKEIKDTPHKIVISGHTDARPYHDESYYSNWELSSARALNTRRVLEEIGLASERIEQVVGYADRKLRMPEDPLNSENRRISILILKLDQKEVK